MSPPLSGAARPLRLAVGLSAAEARRLVLRAQGLDREAPFATLVPGNPASVADQALRAIEHLGYVQIDTISVVERAHHHVLWSRVPGYSPGILGQLQAPAPASPGGPKIFEYWAHAASYLPFRDYRYCLPRMRAYASGARSHWKARDRKTRAFVEDRIRAEGPLPARAFESPPGHKGGTWFEWKPAKRALEQLVTEGVLMVRERKGFQKVFDLAERVLPAGLDTTMPTAREMARYLVFQALRSNGLALEPEMRYLRRDVGKVIASVLGELEEAGEIARVKIEGVREDHFALASALRSDRADSAGQDNESGVRILSPFDNLVIQRRRLKRLFDFEYQIECYVPEAKRKHGYFVLPVLWRDRMSARVDAKADRTQGQLVIHAIHVERPRERKALLAALRPELERFAAFNGCTRVV